MGLCLEAVDVKGQARWRWVLTDGESGAFLGEHHVELDERAQEYRALADLYGYLRWHAAPDPDGRPPSEGALLAYGPGYADAFRLWGVMTGKVLRGAKPRDLPIEQPTTFKLAVNLKLAHAFGIAPPPALLQRADEVIE